MSFFGLRRRRSAGRHIQRAPAAGSTILPGAALETVPLVPVVIAAPRPFITPPQVVEFERMVEPEAATPLLEPEPVAEPERVAEPEPAAAWEEEAEPVAEPEPDGPKVGLFFGDGSHVLIDGSDPRAVAFTAIAEELNR